MSSITLSRHQIEKLAVFLALQETVNSVTIEEHNVSGIGPNHRAVYHNQQQERDYHEDITDYGAW